MKCARCGNEDPSYFYKGAKGIYCRKCIRYSRVLLDEELKSFDYEIAPGVDEYAFSYELSKEQKKASHECVEALKDHDVLLHCVCGAGKTEIAVESIASYLARGLKVCYAIPRKEVVIELSQRFEKIFNKARVTAVYGGHHECLKGDLIVCTCHQLYRYHKSFDLLILDAYGIIGLNSKGSINKGFEKLSPILFSPQKRLTVELRRCHAQIKDFSAKRPTAGMHSSIAGNIVPTNLLQRQSIKLSSDVDLYRGSFWNQNDVSLACAA